MQPHDTTNEPVQIPLSQGYFAIIDIGDYGLISQFKWCVSKRKQYIYASRHVKNPISKTIFMHRIILDAPSGLVVDHINHNGLDNRRSNLRLCTYAQNGQNRLASITNKSGYKGVSWDKDNLIWQVTIKFNGHLYKVGTFPTAESAARAYDSKAVEFFGEFAKLNFPEEH